MIKTVVSILFLFLPPLLAATRLVFVAKYLRVAKEGIFTVLAYLASAIVLVTVLFWFGQIHTTYYGPAGEGGWGFPASYSSLANFGSFFRIDGAT
jgi:uncharacterized membrane protein